MITTLNQVIETIREFANDNGFISDFGYGEISDISTTRATEYPLCWVTHTGSSTITLNGRSMTPELNLTVLMLDRVNNEKPAKDENGGYSTNKGDVMSDRFQVCQDLLFYLTTQFKGSVLADSVSLLPVFDDTTDYSAGWSMTIGLKLQYNNCYIPNK